MRVRLSIATSIWFWLHEHVAPTRKPKMSNKRGSRLLLQVETDTKQQIKKSNITTTSTIVHKQYNHSAAQLTNTNIQPLPISADLYVGRHVYRKGDAPKVLSYPSAAFDSQRYSTVPACSDCKPSEGCLLCHSRRTE